MLPRASAAARHRLDADDQDPAADHPAGPAVQRLGPAVTLGPANPQPDESAHLGPAAPVGLAGPGEQPLIVTAKLRSARALRNAAAQPGHSHVTARGAMVAMFGLFLASSLLASWLGHEVLAGLGYVAACLLGPYVVRRHALLQVVVAPPALFLVALVITQMATAQGTGKHGKVLSVLEGTLLILAAVAPWLLAGTAISVGVAIPRGLVQCVRDLKRELREDIAQRRPWAPRMR